VVGVRHAQLARNEYSSRADTVLLLLVGEVEPGNYLVAECNPCRTMEEAHKVAEVDLKLCPGRLSCRPGGTLNGVEGGEEAPGDNLWMHDEKGPCLDGHSEQSGS
jgi:hypothetical protein